MTFSDAIEQIMKADTLLNNAENSGTILWLACKRGFLTKNCENISKTNIWNLEIDYSMLNQGILSLTEPINNESVKIFNVEGKLIFSTILNGKELQLPKYSSGIYILQIGTLTKKIILKN